jgi:hypothetical protein
VNTTGAPEKVRIVSTAGNRTLSGGDGTYTGTVGSFNANGSQTLVAQAYSGGKIVSTRNITIRVSGCEPPTTQPPTQPTPQGTDGGPITGPNA